MRLGSYYGMTSNNPVEVTIYICGCANTSEKNSSFWKKTSTSKANKMTSKPLHTILFWWGITFFSLLKTFFFTLHSVRMSIPPDFYLSDEVYVSQWFLSWSSWNRLRLSILVSRGGQHFPGWFPRGGSFSRCEWWLVSSMYIHCFSNKCHVPALYFRHRRLVGTG